MKTANVWNVLNYDFNKKKIIPYNVCYVIEADKELQKILKEHINREAFEKRLKSTCMYHFWRRREYEIFVGDAFESNLDKYEKRDIYDQLVLNWDRFSDYIWDAEW